MAYSNSIPQPTDIPSNSQNDILNNFSSLNTQFSVDHIPLIAGSSNGYHTKVTFNDVQSDPTLSSPQTELYTKASSNGTANDRFNDLYYYEKNVSGTSNVLQLTGGGITAAAWCQFNGTSSSPITPGASYNVSGTITRSTNTYTITFSRPFTSANYAVLVTASIGTSSSVVPVITQSTGSCIIQILVNGGSGSLSNNISVVFFGTLA